MEKFKYTEKEHMPVPQLKVGDYIYQPQSALHGYSGYNTYEIRKVEVKWIETNHWNPGHYEVLYAVKGYNRRFFTPEDREYIEGMDKYNACYATSQEAFDVYVHDLYKEVKEKVDMAKNTANKIGYDISQGLLPLLNTSN